MVEWWILTPPSAGAKAAIMMETCQIAQPESGQPCTRFHRENSWQQIPRHRWRTFRQVGKKRLAPPLRGRGLAAYLLNEVVLDLREPGARRVEAFPRR
jgi:hypothetical protein